NELIENQYNEWDKIFNKSKDNSLPNYKNDTNYKLLNIVIDSIEKIKSEVKYIIFLGDFLTHDFNNKFLKAIEGLNIDKNNDLLRSFIKKTIGFISLKLSSILKDIPIYFSLGNTDSFSGDYMLEDNGIFLSSTADLLFKNFIKNKDNKSSFYNTYPKHGYYSMMVDGLENLKVISLCSVFFSEKYKSLKNVNKKNAIENEQLDWLESEFENAIINKQKLCIIGHIPPGVDVRDTIIKSEKENLKVVTEWKSNYNDRYLELLNRYSDNIMFYFAGHVHMDDYRIINKNDSNRSNFIKIVPSISPVFENNPAYQLISIDEENYSILDIETYYINFAESEPKIKKEYSFKNKYNQTPTIVGLESILNNIKDDGFARQLYEKFYSVESKEYIITSHWKWYYCGIKSLHKSSYKSNMHSINKQKV
ncbi:MAG: metallophosphoesterase, partial [Clostridiales bacterium]